MAPDTPAAGMPSAARRSGLPPPPRSAHEATAAVKRTAASLASCNRSLHSATDVLSDIASDLSSASDTSFRLSAGNDGTSSMTASPIGTP